MFSTPSSSIPHTLLAFCALAAPLLPAATAASRQPERPLASGNTASQQKTTGRLPNIIFILVDDLGYGDIGVFYQNQRAAAGNRNQPSHRTPNLDELAQEGIQLRAHYSPAPVCAPSRASLLTGVHQGHSGVRNNQFDKALDSNHTLATVLKEAGYATAAIGKWGLQGKGGNTPEAWPAYPTKRGFDYFYGYVRHGDGHVHYPKEGSLRKKPVQVWEMDAEVSASLDKAYTTDLFTARAKQWISEQATHNPNSPFFLYLAYDTPHATTETPTQAYPAGKGLRGGLQWTGQKGRMINTASGTINSYIHPDYADATWDSDNNPATPEVPWPDVYKRYATMVRRIDDCVGDIVQTLKDLNIDEDTLIVFTSDNGVSSESYIAEDINPSFFRSFGPFDGIKRDLWEGGVRVGALVRWPKAIPAGQISESPSQFHDWMPTFAAMAGLPSPARSDGVSLLPTLTGQGGQLPSTIYSEYQFDGKTPDYRLFAPEKRNARRGQMQMLRIGNFVGVRYDIKDHADNFKIYDVTSDPQQLNNLAPQRPDLQQTFKARALQSRKPAGHAARPYDKAPVPSVAVAATAPGLAWQYFDTVAPWVPNLQGSDRDAAASGIATEIKDAQSHIAENGTLVYSGYLQIPAKGDYTFYLTTEDKALLRLHDIAVIDADYGYDDGGTRSGTLRLAAGMHPIRLYSTRRDAAQNPPALRLEWSADQETALPRQPIPAGALFH